MTKVLIGSLLLNLTFSAITPALAIEGLSVRCESVLLDAPLLSKENSELGGGVAKAKEEAIAELNALIEKDPDLAVLLNKPDFVNLLVAVAENKSIDEIRPLLFKLWQDPELQSINLLRTTGVKVYSNDNSSPLFDAIKKVEAKTQAKSGLRRWASDAKEFLVRMKTQLQGLRRSLSNSKKLIQAEMNPAALDSNLFDFYGYLNLGLEASRLRAWQTPAGSFGGIKVSDIKDIDPMTFIKVLMMASQIEAPISEYSDASGHIFHLYPQASRFMGKTEEQVAYLNQENAKATQSGAPAVKRMTCTNSWCFEENRHEGLLENLARFLAGFALPNSKPFSADRNLSPFVPEDVAFHVMARANNELAASSTYYLLGSHADGNLGVYLRNIRQDEIKHSTVFTGLYKYLMGDTYWNRVKGVMKKTMIELAEKGTESEYNSIFTREPVLAIEIVYAQWQYEKQIRTYLKELPLKTLRKIFETDINLPAMGEVAMDPVKAEKVKTLAKIEAGRRVALAGWPKAQRDRAYALEYFEANNDKAIYDVVLREFHRFRTAEDFGSQAHLEMVERIKKLEAWQVSFEFQRIISDKEVSLLRESLLANLRDYQIMNNQRVRAMGLKVSFISASKGFDIVKDEAFDKIAKVQH